MLKNYEIKTASRLIKQTAKDIFEFGYEDNKQYWQKFMDFHYPPKKVETQPQQLITEARESAVVKRGLNA
jgi:hypothetical protein